MEFIKKLFDFKDDDNLSIGLCRFNDDLFKTTIHKEKSKPKLRRETTLTQILKHDF